MTMQDILTMLKANLEIVNTLKDTYLEQLMGVSLSEIAREGISIVPTDKEIIHVDPETGEETTETVKDYETEDANLIVMYAAYLYRNRVTDSVGGYTTALSATGMPRMLRYALNQRLFSKRTLT